MISFKKLLGKEEKFYDLLEASAEEARVSTEWGVVERILWAWVFTLPVCGFIGYLTTLLCHGLGYR